MREWEIKLIPPKYLSRDDLIERLKNVGFKELESVTEVDTYIDLTPCKCVPKDTVLRIRKSILSNGTVKCELTYKGPKLLKDIKVREELSTQVGDADLVVEMFKKLGFKTYIIRKERTVMVSEVGKVYVDHVEGLGNFLELEIMDAKSEKEFRNALSNLISKLNLINYSLTSKSYLEMILERGGG